MHKRENDNTQGIRHLFPLLSREKKNNYYFGVFSAEESPDYYFRLSFDSHSELYASGIEPDLIITIDFRYNAKEENKWKIEEKRLCYFGINDFDDEKQSWFFMISEKDLRIIADADYITSIEIRKGRFKLDLLVDSPDIWIAFFRAVVAECVNEVKESRELMEFCLQYGLAKKKLQLENAIEAKDTKATDIAKIMARKDGSIDTIHD